MDKSQAKEVITALCEFVIRISKGEATCKEEVEVLPQVAQILLNEWML